jgi:hypothetical protein
MMGRVVKDPFFWPSEFLRGDIPSTNPHQAQSLEAAAQSLQAVAVGPDNRGHFLSPPWRGAKAWRRRRYSMEVMTQIP